MLKLKFCILIGLIVFFSTDAFSGIGAKSVQKSDETTGCRPPADG